jgi:hypothetical protein
MHFVGGHHVSQDIAPAARVPFALSYPVERKTPSFRGDISDLAGSLLLVNVLFEDADWSSTTRSCEVGGRPQSALPIPLHQIGPFLSEHSAGHAFQRVDERRHGDFRRVLDKQMDVVVFSVHLYQSRFKVCTDLGKISF